MTFGNGVHRIIESRAAAHGDAIALVGRDRTLTYRELNQRGNALARHLITRGFRRGSRAIVTMGACPELALVLLAVLKAGGAYTWFDHDEGSDGPSGISLEQDGQGDGRCITIDIQEALAASGHAGPNLPILTRADDVACVLPRRNGCPGVPVPHAAITALQARPLPLKSDWSCAPDAFNLWRPLMAGATVTLTTASPGTDTAAAA